MDNNFDCIIKKMYFCRFKINFIIFFTLKFLIMITKLINLKILSIVCFTFLMTNFSYSQVDENLKTDKNLSIASKMRGKWVFCNSEPVNKYDIVYKINSILPIPSVEEYNLVYAMNYILEMAAKDYASAKMEYDGIIAIEGSNKDIAIKFKKPDENAKYCHAHRIGGKFIFTLCEPVNKYDVVFQIKAKQILGKSIINKVLRKANRKMRIKKKNYDALIIGNRNRHVAVKFK